MKLHYLFLATALFTCLLQGKKLQPTRSSGYYLYKPNQGYYTYANQSTNYFKDADNYANRSSPLTYWDVYDDPTVCDGITVFVCAVYLNSGSDNYLDDNDLSSLSPPSMYSIIYRDSNYSTE